MKVGDHVREKGKASPTMQIEDILDEKAKCYWFEPPGTLVAHGWFAISDLELVRPDMWSEKSTQ